MQYFIFEILVSAARVSAATTIWNAADLIEVSLVHSTDVLLSTSSTQISLF
jgi:hypothetical protein